MFSLFSRKVKDDCSDKTTSKYLTSHTQHGYESKMLIERKRETVLKEECFPNQGPIWHENQTHLYRWNNYYLLYHTSLHVKKIKVRDIFQLYYHKIMIYLSCMRLPMNTIINSTSTITPWVSSKSFSTDKILWSRCEPCTITMW